MVLKITDSTFAGKIISELQIDFDTEKVSIREIITERVKQEVENYNDKKPTYFKGLVEPTNAEKTLNGYKLKQAKPIDAEKQVYIALDAFQKNGFFVLVDDIQSDSLDQLVEIKSDTIVSFVKLTPLVGG